MKNQTPGVSNINFAIAVHVLPGTGIGSAVIAARPETPPD
jgi:hypothetical protein